MKPKIVTVILAAGASSRFNGAKIVAKVQGELSLLEHCLQTLDRVTTAVGIAPAVVMLGAHQTDEVLAITADHHRLINDNWQLGLSSSVKLAGRYAQSQQADAMLIVLADQVALQETEYLQLIEAYIRNNLTTCAFYLQNVGVPAIFLAEDINVLMSIDGDKGAKSILKQHDKNNSLNVVQMEQAQFDIDTPADLARWLDNKD
ncbi:MAG: nucleotidyltransferase family protein [Shewanella sp.]|jgi:molybdenum cofactor cytidylyltransferase|uniref:nucleotidyltransferase family protein n=1 Tax=unclassified Shewanella TaxID=196818 RepID=UPI0015FF8987|nr:MULTISPECIES: nucleotidyltransferase family protein [unclassified Shewanella]MBB1364157.1 nucleotidyltransferase family protein [Shewanella sp. SR44-4]MBO1894990.1 nucleotidyltransferase family protein [Shewanella sp. BF02_Schw]|tara:strand:- start:4166 stop:4774 length:609 start_codon:yes stop_codon:yes gene_type:complete